MNQSASRFEHSGFFSLYRNLLKSAGDSVPVGDRQKIKETIRQSVSQGGYDLIKPNADF